MPFLRCAVAALVLLPALLRAGEPPRRILFIGNSYTGQVRVMVTRLVAASPHRATQMEFITPGGKTLEFHAANRSTLERIRTGKWDVVVLQDQSQTPALFPEKFLAAARSLRAVISKAGARTAYYATWGRRDGDPGNPGRFPTYAKMQEALTHSYRQAAERDGALLVPVGEAWSRVRTDRPVPGRELYKQDGSHPSPQGAYLAACCFYAALFGENPGAVNFDGGLSKEDAAYLSKVAHETVRGDAGRPARARP